jgi:spermidine synthase
MSNTTRKKQFLYTLSFIEGGVVMSTELVGAKILAPYFGTSLYVWACVMALTLGGLACGYFVGGRLSVQKNHEKILMTSVLCAAIYICCLPMLTFLFVYLASNFSLIPAVLVSSSVVLFPPVFIMGMVSPLIIKSITTTHEEVGKKSGEIYAISTLGGICFTFITAFYSIPQWGLTITLIINAGLLAAFSVFYFAKRKTFFPILFFLASIFFSFKTIHKNPSTLYLEEGLLGKLEVEDRIYKTDTSSEMVRYLLINNIIQSCVDVKTNQSKLIYSNVLAQNLSLVNPNAKTALVLGLGGGVISNMLTEKNIQVTAVELDSRVIDVAKKYFKLSADINIIKDDARHALYQLNNKYDIVVIDLFAGEVTPSHVLSEECFFKIKSLLSPDGFIFINTYGYLTSKAGRGNQILLTTLKQAGFASTICYSGDVEHEDYRNLLLFASVKQQSALYASLPKNKIPIFETNLTTTDDKPIIEFANANAVKRWRFSYLRNFILYKTP